MLRGVRWERVGLTPWIAPMGGVMSHVVEVNHYLGLVAVTFWGAVSIEERAIALDEALAGLEVGQCHRIVVDFLGARAAADSFKAGNDHARRLASEPKLRGCRIGYVYPQDASVNPVVEAIAEARGFRFRKFNRVADALDWLLAMPKRDYGAYRQAA